MTNPGGVSERGEGNGGRRREGGDARQQKEGGGEQMEKEMKVITMKGTIRIARRKKADLA